MPQNVIGVDVAKDWIDVFDRAAGRSIRITTQASSLRAFAHKHGDALFVLEPV